VIVGGVVAYIVAFPIGEKSNTSSSTLSPPGSEGNDSSPAAPENSISTAPTYSMSSSPSIVTPFPSASISSSPSIHVPSTSSAPTRPGTMAEIVFAQVLGKCAAGFPDACSDDEFVAMKWFYDMSNHPKDVALDEQRMAERLALVMLYQSTKGYNWNNNDGWLSKKDHCDWWFYRDNVILPSGSSACNSSGYLTTLSLIDNMMSGSLHSSIGLLTSLQRIFMPANQIAGTLPESLFEMQYLQELYLGQTLVTGTLPTAIGQLTNLFVLELSSVQLTGTIPTEIGNMQNLLALEVSSPFGAYYGDNLLSGTIPTEIGKLENLLYLLLWGNEFTGRLPTEIGRLSNLLILDIEENNLNDGSIPSEIGEMAELNGLFLYDNDLTGTIPTEIGNLKELTQIRLGNNALSGPLPSEIGLLSSLFYLDLSLNLLTGTIPRELGQMMNYSEFGSISLDDNIYLTDSIPKEICDVKATYYKSWALSADCRICELNPETNCCDICTQIPISPE